MIERDRTHTRPTTLELERTHPTLPQRGSYMYRYTVYLFRNFALMLPERPRGRGGICSALRACVNVTVQTTVTRQTRQPVPRALCANQLMTRAIDPVLSSHISTTRSLGACADKEALASGLVLACRYASRVYFILYDAHQ